EPLVPLAICEPHSWRPAGNRHASIIFKGRRTGGLRPDGERPRTLAGSEPGPFPRTRNRGGGECHLSSLPFDGDQRALPVSPSPRRVPSTTARPLKA
ncbi:hypothetical protein T484DRAFT_1883863, partial [Baffinella frigidus]